MAKFTGKYHYLGAWKYVLLDILYAIPVIGWIFLLVHAFNHGPENCHENRLHYARSYFVRLLLVVLAVVALAVTVYLTIGFDAFVTNVNKVMNQMQNMPSIM